MPETYSSRLKVLHWIAALLIVGSSVLGFYFSDMPRGDEKSELLRLHASFGLLILMLTAVRLVFRLRDGAPAPVDPDAVAVNRAAKLAHWVIYGILFVMIAAGMGALFTVGWGVPFFGLFEVPTMFAERDMDLHHLFEEIHVFAWWGLATLVGLHVLAALWHHVIKKDGTLKRIWFRRG